MEPAEERRISTVTGKLAKLGFTDPGRAELLLRDPAMAPVETGDLVESFRVAADPDLALENLYRLVSIAPDRDALWRALLHDLTLRGRLLAVLGFSSALGDHLVRHPDEWTSVTEPLGDVRAAVFGAIGVDPDHSEPRARGTETDLLNALRVAYRSGVLRIAAADLNGDLDMPAVGSRLADLAAATLDAALAIARGSLPDEAVSSRLAVIGMGKCGGRELNYASDVDVVFVAEPPEGSDKRVEEAALRTASTLAAGLMQACSQPTPEGAIWPVDAALRPEGNAGPLVRTLASHIAYYQRWAKTWEFQALLKARPVAGDPELGRRYIDALSPMVWRASERENFVEDVQAMRRRVEDHIPHAQADRQLKLGPGGLRDVEFAVQLLQLVHGRSDVALRSGSTLAALDALSSGGYVSRADALSLAEAYRFLRTLEHRMQLYQLRRTHVLPTAHEDLRRLGRSLGFRADPSRELTEERQRHAREVRRLHEKLFYRPLLLAVARLPTEEARLTPQAARQRLEALGYTDPAGALRHIEALTSGVSRRASIQRTLLPVLLGWFADAADPDAGLLSFRKVSDALGATPWYLRLLRDERAAAERMAWLLGSSRYVSDLLIRAPDGVAMLGDDDELVPRSRDGLESEMLAAVRRHDDPDTGVTAVRALRRRELFRVAVADLLGLASVRTVGEALTSIAAATVSAALEAARRKVEGELGERRAKLTALAMGRFGGAELGYASDADLVFVYEPAGAGEEAAAQAATAIAEELRRLLARPAPDPPLAIDVDLRPEGRQGPIVRSVDSYAAYYSRWSSPWESQALLRAAPVAGDAELGERLLRIIDPVRWPAHGLTHSALREIRRLKARMEAERLPRGADPTTHTKLGRGGLTDVEWVAQLLQLRHAFEVPSLRTTSTLHALDAAAHAGLLDRHDADVLEAAWRKATRVRNAIMLVRGRPSDGIPADLRERAGIARVLGYEPGRTGDLLEDYRRVTRRARVVAERVFYS